MVLLYENPGGKGEMKKQDKSPCTKKPFRVGYTFKEWKDYGNERFKEDKPNGK